jgi:tRNA A-37 threonylcarbamoyl transferase component Bud32
VSWRDWMKKLVIDGANPLNGEDATSEPEAPGGTDATDPTGASRPSRPDRAATLARLVTVGAPGGISEEEALAILRGLRATPEEGRAVAALAERRRVRPLPTRLDLALASAFADRGETTEALEVLSSDPSSPALLFAADLHADRGALPAALALTERVLSRDLDHPGARERHRRWLAALGLSRDPTRNPRGDDHTIVARDPDAPFILLREVARGGAGAVYEAEDRELGRRVALKVYHQPARDRAQLTHEARVASALAGPGIPRVFDADPDHGWIALEWAARGALKTALRSGAASGSGASAAEHLLPFDRWLLPLAETLARTHASGWVHLDVKPANVLLDSTGRPLLADFGIARRAGEVSPPGSLGYVAPERLAGAAAAFTDDVFGLGRLLEDVLDALPEHPELVARFRPLATACTGPLETRPPTAAAVLTRLRVEHS